MQSTLNKGAPARLKCGDDRKLGFLATYSVEIIKDSMNGPFRTTTRESIVELVDLAENAEKGARIIAWHFHPSSLGVDYPHVHLPSELRQDDRFQIARAHVPTGRVALEDIVLFLIEEMSVIAARKDYREQLESTRIEHVAHRSW